MKTLKYRSVFSTLCLAMLSVFLFTSCEKESDDGPVQVEQVDRLEKFKRLSFTTLNSSNSDGGYVGDNGTVTYVRAGSNGNTFAQTSSGPSFTDPRSSGSSFTVSSSFGEGGGSATLDGEKYDMAFAFCASADFMDLIDIDGEDEDDDVALDIFIGIAGEFNFDNDDNEDESSEGNDNIGLDMVLYAFSYNDGSEIGSFEDLFGDEEPGKAAFVIAVAFDDEGKATFYFGEEGTVIFSGSEVNLNGVKMTKLEYTEDEEGMELSDEIVDLEANLECVVLELEEE